MFVKELSGLDSVVPNTAGFMWLVISLIFSIFDNKLFTLKWQKLRHLVFKSSDVFSSFNWF